MTLEIKNYEIELTKLVPTEKNPRQISKKDFDELKKSLKDFPEMREIREVVVDENLRILGGHMRVKALMELGEKKVPVKQVFGLTEKQKDKFVIKDNLQNGEWDMDKLANEWDEMELQEWGLDLNAPKIDWADVDELSDETYEQPEHEMLECPACHHIDRKIHFKKVGEESE